MQEKKYFYETMNLFSCFSLITVKCKYRLIEVASKKKKKKNLGDRSWFINTKVDDGNHILVPFSTQKPLEDKVRFLVSLISK